MNRFFLTTCLVFSCYFLCAQSATSIVGVWITQDNDSKVTISRDSNGKFNGRITWLKDPLEEDGSPKVDNENPNRNLRNRPIMGLKVLEGFKFDNDRKQWVDGKIYDPNNGKTYSCRMWFDGSQDRLKVRGYIGFSLLGREVEWTRDR